MSEDKGKKPIDPQMFDVLMKFAAKAGNQNKADEPDLNYPEPDEKEESTDENKRETSRKRK